MRWRKKKKQDNLLGSSLAIQIPSFVGPTGPTTPTLLSTALFRGATGATYSPPEEIPIPVIEDKGLAIEPIVGLRSYYIDLEDMALVSHNGCYWPQRKPLYAHCHRDLFAEHEVPGEECQCGIYAWSENDIGKVSGGVFGEVYLWGDVLVCENGYRAEIAYPKSITLRTPAATRVIRRVRDGLAEAYGIPVTVSLSDPYTDQPF